MIEIIRDIRENTRIQDHEAQAARARDYVAGLTEGADIDDVIDGPVVADFGRHFGEALIRRGWCLWRVSPRERIVLDAYLVHRMYPTSPKAWEALKNLGVQEGPGMSLELRECPTCRTTMAKKIKGDE